MSGGRGPPRRAARRPVAGDAARPGAGRARPHLRRAVRRDHEPELPRRRRPGRRTGTSSAWPATTPICWASAARSSTPRRSRRRVSASGRRSSAFIRPEGYLVTRFIEGVPVCDEAVHQPETHPAGRRLDPAHPRRPGHPRPVHAASGSSRPTGRWRWPAACRSPPSTSWRWPSRGGSSSPSSPRPLELRPCHNDLLNANFIDDGTRIRIVDWEYAGLGDPFFDLGNFCVNHDLTPDEDAVLLLGPTRARSAAPRGRAADPDARSSPTSARRCGASCSRASARSMSTSSRTPPSTSTGSWRTPPRRPSSAPCATRPSD